MNTRLVLCGLALLVSGCFGPKPTVVRVEMQRVEKDHDLYVVSAEIHNAVGGDGEVSIEGKLIERSTGKTYRAEEKVHLAGHETTVVKLRIEAPPGNYEAEVSAEYPPE